MYMVYLRTQKYGAKIRKLVEAALKSKMSLYPCPKCSKVKVRRTMNAVWKCKSCENVFAGAAYSLTSEAGIISARLVREYAKL